MSYYSQQQAIPTSTTTSSTTTTTNNVDPRDPSRYRSEYDERSGTVLHKGGPYGDFRSNFQDRERPVATTTSTTVSSGGIAPVSTVAGVPLVTSTAVPIVGVTPVVQQQTVTTTVRETRPVYTGPTPVPAHPLVTPQVPEGTTILNYPGAAAAGPAVVNPTALPVGPTSGMQQGSSHDRYFRSTNHYLPAVGKDGHVSNYIPGANTNAADVQPVLYPTQSVTGGAPIVQQGTYPTSGTMTGMTATGTGPASSKYADYSHGDTAIGMYGNRPGNTGAVNNYPANRAAFDNGDYGGYTRASVAHHEPRHHHHQAHKETTTSTTTTTTSVPVVATTTTPVVQTTVAPATSLGGMYDKNAIEPAYQPRDMNTV